MNWSNLLYRALRRLRLQPLLNWSAPLPDASIQAPLLGDPLGSGLMLYGGSWKPEAFRRIARSVSFSTVLDVGANEGQTILDLARSGLPIPGIVAFEPNPACAYYLQKLIRLNSWRHVQVFPVALSDAARCVSLDLGSENDSSASFVPDLRPGHPIAERVIVPCFPLDDLVESGALLPLSTLLLKIDVEGAELDVLRGSQRLLRALRPLIMCEVLWAHCQERIAYMRSRNTELMSLLGASEYLLFRFVLARDQRSVTGIEQLSEFPSGVYTVDNAHQCDYLFAPREHASSLQESFRCTGLSAPPRHPS